MTTLLKEMRIAQLSSQNERTLEIRSKKQSQVVGNGITESVKSYNMHKKSKKITK